MHDTVQYPYHARQKAPSACPQGTPAPQHGPAPTDTRVTDLGHGKSTFKWSEYQSPTPAQLDALQQQFDFHPLAMDDVRSFDERAKVLDFGTYLFITVHALMHDNGEMHDHELEVFLGRDILVTVHVDPLPEIEVALKRFLADPKRQDLGPDYFLYLIVDELTNNLFPILDKMDDEVDVVEEETLVKATPQTLHGFSNSNRNIFKCAAALPRARRHERSRRHTLWLDRRQEPRSIIAMSMTASRAFMN